MTQEEINIVVNDIIKTKILIEELWTYHPDNPHQVDVEVQTKILKEKLNKLEEQFKNI